MSGQGDSQSEAKLVHRYDSGCGYSCAQETAIDLGLKAAKPDDRIAVRFCSKEPMPLALATAAAAYAYVISILEGSYGYTAERVLFLRSEDCLGPHAAVTATEFWVLPTGAKAPHSVESMTSNRVHFETVVSIGMTTNRRAYLAALKKLQERLGKDPRAIGIVLGHYYKSPNPQVKQRLREAKAALDRSGLPQERYFVRLAPWTGEYSLGSPEPRYPSLFIVEVAKVRETVRR
jgi:hypothetical protein